VQCRRKLNAVFREELNARRKNATSEVKDDLMSGLMRMEDEQGNKLSDDEVLDSIVSLVVGGYESASSAIMWAVYHLAKSPDVLSKLRVIVHLRPYRITVYTFLSIFHHIMQLLCT
jgi:ent-kaurenoic acid hydroxylase